MCRSPTTSPTTMTPDGSGRFAGMRRWVKGSFKRNSKDRSDLERGPCSLSLDGTPSPILPPELLLQIAVFAASASQDAYCSMSLVSKWVRTCIEREALPHVPIRIESTAQIIAFHKLIVRSRPELAAGVRHLWICGGQPSRKGKTRGYSEPTPSAWRKVKESAFEQLQIFSQCTNLVSLACSFPVLFLCFKPYTRDIFARHDQLKDLTLFENWNLWECFALAPPLQSPNLFLQLTHLAILDSVAPHFPIRLFPSLRCFSAEISPTLPHSAMQALKADDLLIAPLPRAIQALPRAVDIALLLVDTAELGIRDIVSDQGRPWRMRIGTPRYFQWWSDRN